MRTDIAIPRPISEAAEQLAQKLDISLSELYTAALTAYVTTHQKNEVTERLNQVYETETSTLEPVLVQLQVASLDGATW
ncbi:MAG: hypothetical protein AB1797_08890 [bacterium]